MPGLVPGIHVFARTSKKDVDGRDKPGHDDDGGRHCEERKRRSNPSIRYAAPWIASLTLAMTREVLGATTRFPHPTRIFFILFVDQIFTTFIERLFTNAFDAISKSRAIPCV